MQTLLRGQFSNLYAPEDKIIGSPTGGGVESIVDFLNEEDTSEKKEDLLADEEDDEDEEVSPKGGKKTKESDEEDEDDKKIGDKDEEEKEELELEEDEEPDEEELELITPVSRKAVLKKYPTLFKEFPYLEKAMYREQAYTEIIPTIEDAKEIVERVKNFDRFESEILSGSSETLLKTVKDSDPGAFNKIVDNYLGNLQKVDQPAYFHVVGNVIKSTILSMAREAKASQNDNLLGAAQILNQFIYGTSEFVPPSNLAGGQQNQEVDNEKNKLQLERAEYMKERFETSLEDLSGRVQNILKSTITQHIDPSGDMTDYVKKNAVKDAIENLEELIEADTRFGKMKDKLWEKAVEANFSQKSINAIRNAYLSKSKSLLKSVIQKSRNDALKGQGKRSKDNREVDTRPRTSQSRSANEDRDRNDTRPLRKGEIPRGMSNRDFIMSD